MPVYEYQDLETGEIVELVKHHSEADPIASVIEHEGRKLRRVFSSSAFGMETIQDDPRPRRSLAKGMPGFDRYDKRGYPIATNKELKQRGFVENPWLDIYR